MVVREVSNEKQIRIVDLLTRLINEKVEDSSALNQEGPNERAFISLEPILEGGKCDE